jgi:hemimethylated DNA binding protein
LGDVIQHKIFGYRGVVVAWDYEENDTHNDYHRNDIEPTETSDKKIPYYYILLACQDYINELDETQHVQYVSEENLERCSPELRHLIQVPLHDGWKHLDDGQYQAPLEKQYKYGLDVDKSETKISLITERCINVLQDIILQWQVKSLVSLREDCMYQKSCHWIIGMLFYK